MQIIHHKSYSDADWKINHNHFQFDICDLDNDNKKQLGQEQKQSWHKLHPNLSDLAQLLLDSAAGYTLYISVSNAETVDSSAGDFPIVSQHDGLGGWPGSHGVFTSR